MHRLVRIAGAVLGVLLVSVCTTYADDWVAARLRGTVLQLVDNEWIPLGRKDVVSDDRAIRTGATGRVTFQRDEETIELGPNTEIRIHDRIGQRFTTIEQNIGVVTVEADVLNVQHFAVVNPYLAAVVKGTKFIVSSSETGASVVVTRGKVDVAEESTGKHKMVLAGEAALVRKGAANMTVVGSGAGAELTPAQIKELEKLAKDAAKAADKAAKDAAKAAEKAAKEAAKAAEKAAKEAEKAIKDAEKAAKKKGKKLAGLLP